MPRKTQRKKSLNKDGSGTRWDEQWMRQYGHLVKYRARNRDGWPSTLEEYPAGNRLGQWAHRQRDLQARRKLSPERAKLLAKLGFPWEKTDERQSHWDEQYTHLQQYRRRFPDRWPYAREEFPKGNRLGLWVWRQRQNHARRKLPKARLAALAKIDFPLTLPDSWETHFQTLKEYRATHGDRWPKAREEFPAGNRLGLWCHLQRCAYKADNLLPERVSKLNRIGFLWSVKNLGWTRYYQ
ncbi:MAG TPA: helicase associated domain-containing protein, partial [Fibrobacteria bacterium]|nr:helicase associated domain-containing protein [Fibrobacteria bacterium]